MLFLLSLYSKGCLLPRCLNCPAQFAQPPLPPHREPFICVVEGRFLVVSWTLFYKCLLGKRKKKRIVTVWIFPAPYYNKHSKNSRSANSFSTSLASSSDLWPRDSSGLLPMVIFPTLCCTLKLFQDRTLGPCGECCLPGEYSGSFSWF